MYAYLPSLRHRNVKALLDGWMRLFRRYILVKNRKAKASREQGDGRNRAIWPVRSLRRAHNGLESSLTKARDNLAWLWLWKEASSTGKQSGVRREIMETGRTTAPSPSLRTGIKRVGLIYYRKETLLQSYLDILGGINGRHALLQTVSTWHQCFKLPWLQVWTEFPPHWSAFPPVLLSYRFHLKYKYSTWVCT